MSCLTLYLIEASFNTFVSIADPDQAALVGAAWSLGLLQVSEYSDIRGSEYKIEYGYSSLPKSLDRDLFFFFN